MFGGVGIWSGGAATAASGALDKRITDLEGLKEQLDASAKLFRDSVTATINAKNEIIDNVERANTLIDLIKSADGSDTGERLRDSGHHRCDP